MPAVHEDLSTQPRRLEAVSSMVKVVGRYVDGLVQLRAEAMPGWLTRLGVSPGWQVGHLATSAVQPSRIAVCGQQPGGRWDGCETISVFGFTGISPVEVVRNNAGCTLRGLAAARITVEFVETPLLPGATAVRSSGYFEVAGLWLWARYSTYVAASEEPGQGRLIEHAVFVESECQARLRDDIARLTHAVYQAFYHHSSDTLTESAALRGLRIRFDRLCDPLSFFGEIQPAEPRPSVLVVEVDHIHVSYSLHRLVERGIPRGETTIVIQFTQFEHAVGDQRVDQLERFVFDDGQGLTEILPGHVPMDPVQFDPVNEAPAQYILTRRHHMLAVCFVITESSYPDSRVHDADA
jgi:hypothetical protein